MEIRRIIHEFYQPVYRYAFRLTGSAADAEDLVQETFLMACTRGDQLRDESKVGPWLFGILRGCVGKYFRRRRPTAAGTLDLDLDGFPAVRADEPIDEQELRSALAELPDDFRTVLLMFYFEELTYQEIANALELPIGTVMSRLARAKTHLRRRIHWEDDTT